MSNEQGQQASGDLLNGSAGGQQSSGDTTANTGAAPTDTNASGGQPAGDNLPEWLKGIDDDLRKDASLLNFKDVKDLAKSYVHAKKFVGADKIVVPTKYTTPDQWKEIYQKLGLPKEESQYALNRAENSSIDKGFFDGLKKTAYEAGILPQQADHLVKFYETKINEMNQNLSNEVAKDSEKNVQELKDEWGDSFDANIQKANYALKELGGEKMIEHIKSLGLENDAYLVKMLAKAGQAISGDGFPGVSQTNNAGPMTPDSAQAKLDEMRINPIATDANHPNHDGFIREMERIAKFAYGNK